MTQSPPPRRPRRRRANLSAAVLRALLALAMFALFGGICVAALVGPGAARAAQVLTILAPLLAIVLGFYFGQRRE